MSLDNAPTIKYSCDQYSRFCDQSVRMQQVLTSFTSSLKTALLLIPDNTFIPLSFETRQLNEVKQRFYGCMTKIRVQMESELAVLLEVNRYVGSISLQFRKVIDLMKHESDRSQVTLLQLDHQLRLKEQEVTDCQNALQSQNVRYLEDKWKQQQYLSYPITNCEGSTTAYLQLLKQFRNKIQMQISFEKEEMTLLSASISAKLRELKAKMLEAWNLIEFNARTLRSRKPIETRYEEKYSEIERQYLIKEKKADGFQFDKLKEIKKKLKLLEQADISQSRQYFSYSRSDSRDRPMEESQVIALLQA